MYANADKLRVDKDNIIMMGYSGGTYASSQGSIQFFDERLLTNCKYQTVQLKGFIGMSGVGYFSDKNIYEIFNGNH